MDKKPNRSQYCEPEDPKNNSFLCFMKREMAIRTREGVFLLCLHQALPGVLCPGLRSSTKKDVDMEESREEAMKIIRRLGHPSYKGAEGAGIVQSG